MQAYEISTAQTGPHQHLIDVVRRYKNSVFQRPIPNVQKDAFNCIIQFFEKRKRPLILDSGCGTGQSTLYLARAYPDHDVIGIDKSAHRLARSLPSDRSNYLLIRAELIDLWRLLAKAKLPIHRHYVLYPNPWPKIGQLRRRFHAHPVFRSMLSLAPYFELRTNWRIYAEEMVLALKEYEQQPEMRRKTDTVAMSLFEKKYLAAGCDLFIVTNQTIGTSFQSQFDTSD